MMSKRPQKRRRLSIALIAATSGAGADKDANCPIALKDTTVQAHTNLRDGSWRGDDSCVSCHRSLLSTNGNWGLQIICARCRATSCAVCARICTALPPSVPPTPQLTFSPSPPGTPVHVPLDAAARHLPLALPHLHLRASRRTTVGIVLEDVDEDELNIHERDMQRSRVLASGRSTATNVNGNLDLTRDSGADGSRAQAEPVNGLMSVLRTKRRSDGSWADNQDDNSSLGDTDCGSGSLAGDPDSDCAGRNVREKKMNSSQGILPGCRRTFCKSCCFENMQLGLTTCYDCYGIGAPSTSDGNTSLTGRHHLQHPATLDTHHIDRFNYNYSPATSTPSPL